MTFDISITLNAKEEHNQALVRRLAAAELRKLRALPEHAEKNTGFSLRLLKKSLDARHGRQKVHLRFRASIGGTAEEAEAADGAPPVWKDADGRLAVVIVGAGPAGLFGALKLLEYGIRPIIVERGAETAARKQDIAKISTLGAVDSDSNYCFGEGGAGTFSDGKLYTRSKKRGSVAGILSTLVRFGADEKILTDSHPHIGTDRLPLVVNAIKAEIKRHGGEFHFRTRCTGFLNGSDGRISGILAERADGSAREEFRGDAVVLAAGHSASDIYKLLADAAPAALEAKTFAAGVRVEHPRALIDRIQYHGKSGGGLPAAEYRLAAQVEGRGVYSFCMCPGGFVVPSATGPEEIVVNGMSAAARNSKWSNAAIVVETRAEDIPEEFQQKAADAGCPALAGLFFRTALEQETKRRGSGQSAPSQRLTDFLAEKSSDTLPAASYTPGVVPSRLDRWLPPHIARRLTEGFSAFGRSMRGFVCRDALLIASETRTSTPVRILRNERTYECAELAGLYPAGEGSGYSGGIVSSALDGQNVCRAVAEQLCGGTAR